MTAWSSRCFLRMTALFASVCLIVGSPAGAEEPPAASADVVTSAPVAVVLKANALIPLRMQDTVSSETTARGVSFTLVVTDDVYVDDRVVIPAGSVAHGEVIHATKAGIFGKAGELSITSRYVTVGDRRIRLRSLLAAAGQTKADLAAGVGLVVPFAPFFIRGKDLVVPADTELVARVAADELFEFQPTLATEPGSIE